MKSRTNDFRIHFTGIGGVSMSSLAKYLLGLGFTVSGSDAAGGEALDELAAAGAKVHVGHSADFIGDAQMLVRSSAIPDDNPEIVEANSRGLYVVTRAELLAMVSENFAVRVGVSGCHGKTTATCMLAHIFKCANESFTLHVGGYDVDFGNYRNTGSKYFLSEVCEFRKNISKFDPDVAVCLSTEPDHLDCYSGADDLKDSYFSFLDRAKKKIVFGDDVNLSAYGGADVVRFSYGDGGDYYPVQVRSSHGAYSFTLCHRGEKLFDVKLKVYGRHNVINAVAAAACALEIGLPTESVRKGLAEFCGVRRRFERLGKFCGAQVFADYAHHPREITAALSAAKEIAEGRLFVVFQPHTFSRTLYLMDGFVQALKDVDRLAIYKTYPAREKYIYGGSAYDLYSALGKKGDYFGEPERLAAHLRSVLKRGDTLLVLGAGDIYEIIKNIV